MSKFGQKLDNYFEVSKRGSSFKVEVFAGIATFLAMAYILTTNPFMMQGFGLSTDRTASLIIATALGALIGTLLIAILANMPFAQAPGMGLNAQIGTIVAFGVGSGAASIRFSYANAMAIVLISGILFLLVSVIPIGKNKETGAWVTIREKIFDGIPPALRTAIPVGIGLFIAFVGLQNAKVIVDSGTLVSLVSLSNWHLGNEACQAIVCLFGLIVIAVLSHCKVKGSVIIGILAATILAIPLKVAKIDVLLGKDPTVSWKFWENFGKFFSFDEAEGAFGVVFKHGFNFPSGAIITVIMLVITFSMIDMFDTMGTVVGCAANAGLVDEKGKPFKYNRIMYADSIATVAGAMLGTSTVTTFVESGTGIAEGGRTGFASIITAILFLLSIFILPVFAFIPSAAAAAGLVYVGVLMMKSVKNIDFTDVRISVPAFVTIIGMPFAYSITGGIGLGILTYIFISIICYVVDIIKFSAAKNKATEEGAAPEKPKWPVSVITGIIGLLFIIYFFVPTVF